MWNEQDDAQLAALLKRKLRDVAIAIRESETPYERNRLKHQRERYREMLRKVEAGAYNGDIIFSELRASAALRQEARLSSGLHSSISGGRAYVNAYGAVDFDYEGAFRKKRYYGIVLPIVLFVLAVAAIASIAVGALSPTPIDAATARKISDATGGAININAIFKYRIDKDRDITVRPGADGKWQWPEADYKDLPGTEELEAEATRILEEKRASGIENPGVALSADLECTEIYIDAIDILKAFFKTKFMKETRIAIIEDLPAFQGASYYDALFLSGGKEDSLSIRKNADGNYDFEAVYHAIGVYGEIFCLMILIALAIVLFVQNLVRIFTYTTRRLHGVTLLALFAGILLFVCPALASTEGTRLGPAFSNYFMSLTNPTGFAENASAEVGATITGLLPVALLLISLILPPFFKNRRKTFPARIPRGNKKVHI